MAIGEQDFAYKRGVVLGLTLAEILLLLVFCLLLAAGFVLQQSEGKVQAAQAAADAAKADPSDLQGMVERLQVLKPSAQSVPDFTRDLMRAYELDKLNPDRLRDKNTQNFVESVKQNTEKLLAAKPPGQSMEEYVNEMAKRMATPPAPPAPPPSQTAGDRTGKHNWPPIITLSEAGGYNFALGQAKLTPGFEAQLHDTIVPKILDIIRDYGVDAIEVVGHTDELPVAGKRSNLDTAMAPVLRGERSSDDLQGDDNTGLGMARAVAVVRSLLADPRLKGYTIHPLSAGQLIDVDQKLAVGGNTGDVKERRRIEIRLRRLAGNTN